MEKKLIGILVIFLLVFCLLIPPTPQAQTTKGGVIHWKGQRGGSSSMIAPYGPFGPKQTGVNGNFEIWYDWFQKASGGRLVIDVAEPGAIFQVSESDIAVEKNVAQIVFWVVGSWYVGRIPEADIETGGVFLFENEQQCFECLHKYGLYQALQRVYAKRNIKWIPNHVDTIQGIATNFPAPNPASFKGKKIRAVGIISDYIRMLGAVPVPIPWGDVYMAMKSGTVDGACVGTAALEELKLKEIAKGYVHPPDISRFLSGTIINMDAFKALPQDLQDLFQRDTPYVSYAASTSYRNQCDWILKNAEKNYGIKVYAWPREDINKLTQQVVDDIFPNMAKKSKDSAELLEIVKKQMRAYGRIK